MKYSYLHKSISFFTNWLVLYLSLIFWGGGKHTFLAAYIYSFIEPLTFVLCCIFIGCILSFFYTLSLHSSNENNTAKYKDYIIDDFRHIPSDEIGEYICFRYFSFFNLHIYFLVKLFIFYPVFLICISINKLYNFSIKNLNYKRYLWVFFNYCLVYFI